MRHYTTSATSRFVQAICLAGLLLRAAGAAGPPTPPEEVPAPGPLFNPDRFNQIQFAMFAFGASSQPSRPFATWQVLVAGALPNVQAWTLDGAMTRREPLMFTGTSSAVLSGFNANPFATLATLRAGHDLRCWALRDTDRFHSLPAEWLGSVEDRKALAEGTLETEHYGRVVALANFTSDKAFRDNVKTDVGITALMDDPEFHRGQVVFVEGHLRKVARLKPQRESRDEGVNDLYEAWIFPDKMGSQAVCVAFTEWPADLPRSLLGRSHIAERVRVRAAGYFFKLQQYHTADRNRPDKVAPLVVGHTIAPLVVKTNDDAFNPAWVKPIIYIVPVMFVTLIFTVVGLTYWFRRQDQILQKRLRLARDAEFVPPPPDALPVAAPVAPQRAAPARPTIPLRHNLPGRADRGDGSSSDAGPSESGGKPPDDQSGALPRPGAGS